MSKSKKPYEIRRTKPVIFESSTTILNGDGHYENIPNHESIQESAQFYYVQIGANGEVMNTSQMYPTKKGAKQGVIDSVNRHSSFRFRDQPNALYKYKEWSIWATDTTLKTKTHE